MLKRPWDEQRQLRIAQETDAVTGLMRLVQLGRIAAVRSPIHDEENMRNSNEDRAAAIASWLDALPSPTVVPPRIAERGTELTKRGFGPFDALHLAWAEGLRADMLVTTDDRFVRRAGRATVASRVRVVFPATALARASE